MAEMLQDGDSVSAEGSGALSAAAPAEVEFDTARAAWRTTSADDFALAIAAGGTESPRGLLVITRPVNGLPGAGSYDTAGAAASVSTLEAMSQEALAERAEHFQGFGLIEREGVLYVLTGFDSGAVSIDATQDGRVAGSVEGLLSAVRVDTGAVVKPIEVKAQFDAVEGLENFYFRSPESRYMD
jgi:hypothetical protein